MRVAHPFDVAEMIRRIGKLSSEGLAVPAEDAAHGPLILEEDRSGEEAGLVVVAADRRIVDVRHLGLQIVEILGQAREIGIAVEPCHLRGLGEIVADEERQQDHVGLQLQPFVDEDGQVFPRTDAGNPHVDQFGAHTIGLQPLFDQRKVVVSIRHDAEREGIPDPQDAIDAGLLVDLEFHVVEAARV